MAAIAPLAFTVWSLSSVLAASRQGSAALLVGVWAAALLLGALTVFAHRDPRPTPQGGGVFLFAGTVAPLLIYLSVFAARYGLAVWAGFQPALALQLTLAAVAISAAAAGRFIADLAPLLRAARRPAGLALAAR